MEGFPIHCALYSSVLWDASQISRWSMLVAKLDWWRKQILARCLTFEIQKNSLKSGFAKNLDFSISKMWQYCILLYELITWAQISNIHINWKIKWLLYSSFQADSDLSTVKMLNVQENELIKHLTFFCLWCKPAKLDKTWGLVYYFITFGLIMCVQIS